MISGKINYKMRLGRLIVAIGGFILLLSFLYWIWTIPYYEFPLVGKIAFTGLGMVPTGSVIYLTGEDEHE